jgi:hypothetical protein
MTFHETVAPRSHLSRISNVHEIAYNLASDTIILSLCSLFWKDKSKSSAITTLSVYAPYQRLNGWTSLYETRYVYHGTWAHLNGVLHKSLISVCLSVYPTIIARQWLGKNVTAATNIHATVKELLDSSFYMLWLPCNCLAVAVSFGSTIPAFNRHYNMYICFVLSLTL